MTWHCTCARTPCDGLDCGVWLPGQPPRKVPAPKTPEQMADSIASVLEDLWTARRWMKWQPNIEGDFTKGGEWVPDLDAIAEQFGTAQRGEAQHDG